MQPGRRIGDYELVRRIGSGGMAEVWMGRRALVAGVTKSVAIKFISPRMAESQRHRDMFLEEARLSMLMSHSNVVQVFDAGQDGDHLYMVMEWVDGINLAQLGELMRAVDKRMTPNVVGYIIGEILQGLSYAHNLYHEGQHVGIIHRDISPHNVLVSVSGEVKIVDFGVARLASEDTSGLHIKGKLRYMAPEHLAGHSKSPGVDVFGAGAVLHELLTGQKFRGAANEMQLYQVILGGQLEPLPPTIEVPPQLEALRSGLLQPAEQQRIPSADHALQMLEQWPGYRSAAGELGRICRTFMGVDAPRSGIHAMPTQSAMDQLGDTVLPAATNTWSAPHPDPTNPSGRAGTSPDMAPVDADASTVMDVRERPRGPMIAAIVVAGGFVVGGASVLGVYLARDDDEPKVAIAPSSAPKAETPAEVEAPQPLVPSDPVFPEAGGTTTNAAESTPVATQPRDGPVETGDAPVEAEATPAEPAPPAVEEEPEPPKPSRSTRSSTRRTPKATAPAKVTFRLKTPLRFAYVRIDGGSSIPLEPFATRKVKPGSHKIDWRATEDKPWVRGGTFDFRSGKSYTVRVSSKGVQVE